MSRSFLALGVTALIGAVPLAAQQRGTLEFGAFGSTASYDNSLGLGNGGGGGLRAGLFLDPRWSLEFDGSGMNSSRPLGLPGAQVTSLAARVALTPLVVGPTSWIISAGGVHTDYGVSSSYGMSGLVGAKLALGSRLAFRVDGTADYMPHRRDTNLGIRAGFSIFRQPNDHERTVTMVGPPAVVMMQRPDSVNAMEQGRLRMIASNYDALRDSLARSRYATPAVPQSSATSLATMHEMIHFTTDSSVLSDSARSILDEKVAIFRTNPDMRIVIVGNTDERATDAYNLALGGRRADAAKAYLVSRGIDAIRIEIASRGETKPIAAGTTPDAQAQNRRAEFRLLVASDYLVPPTKK